MNGTQKPTLENTVTEPHKASSPPIITKRQGWQVVSLKNFLQSLPPQLVTQNLHVCEINNGRVCFRGHGSHVSRPRGAAPRRFCHDRSFRGAQCKSRRGVEARQAESRSPHAVWHDCAR